jgi:hypothetical protein
VTGAQQSNIEAQIVFRPEQLPDLWLVRREILLGLILAQTNHVTRFPFVYTYISEGIVLVASENTCSSSKVVNKPLRERQEFAQITQLQHPGRLSPDSYISVGIERPFMDPSTLKNRNLLSAC